MATPQVWWASRSLRPQGDPYSVSRSRNGTLSNASGPSTPAPDQVPFATRSRATTGLTAVCQTTAWEPYSSIVCSLSTTWYRYVDGGWPSLPVPVTQVPAQVLPVILSPSVAGSGRQAATTSRGDTDWPRTETGEVESNPSLWSVLSTS